MFIPSSTIERFMYLKHILGNSLLHNVAALIPPNLFTASLTRNEKLKKLKLKLTSENVSFVHRTIQRVSDQIIDFKKSKFQNKTIKKISDKFSTLI